MRMMLRIGEHKARSEHHEASCGIGGTSRTGTWDRSDWPAPPPAGALLTKALELTRPAACESCLSRVIACFSTGAVETRPDAAPLCAATRPRAVGEPSSQLTSVTIQKCRLIVTVMPPLSSWKGWAKNRAGEDGESPWCRTG